MVWDSAQNSNLVTKWLTILQHTWKTLLKTFLDWVSLRLTQPHYPRGRWTCSQVDVFKHDSNPQMFGLRKSLQRNCLHSMAGTFVQNDAQSILNFPCDVTLQSTKMYKLLHWTLFSVCVLRAPWACTAHFCKMHVELWLVGKQHPAGMYRP